MINRIAQSAGNSNVKAVDLFHVGYGIDNSNSRTAGFASSAGAKTVCVDARLALPALPAFLTFLASWTSGQSFSSAVNSANRAGHPLDLVTMAGLMVTHWSLATSIDSSRFVAGSEAKTISSNP